MKVIRRARRSKGRTVSILAAFCYLLLVGYLALAVHEAAGPPDAAALGAPPLASVVAVGETRWKSGGPLIAVVIDDLGIDERRTREAIALPAAVSLSFLPYGDGTPLLSREAHLAGHEIIAHLPMEPDGGADPGPMALRLAHSPAEIESRIAWALSRVAHFDGVNNHMGSRFTSSRAALAPVMRALALRGVYFLDSRTTAESLAESAAREAGLLAGARDVFLDDTDDRISVARELARAESQASLAGSAIAVGHPRPETLAALKHWIGEMELRGYRLVPVSAVLRRRSGAAAQTSQIAPMLSPQG